MKIVDRKTFLDMPKGTFYARIPTPIIIEGLSVKDDPRGENDWWYRPVTNWDANDDGEWTDRYFAMVGGASFPIDEGTGPDGLYEPKDQFLVFERADLLALQGWIEEALKVTT